MGQIQFIFVECNRKLDNTDNPSQDSSVGACQLGIGEVLGSNPSKGKNFSMKIT